MAQPRRKPTLGVGVFVLRQGKILIGRRHLSCKRGAECLALPGGHVDLTESFESAAVREVREEADVVCRIRPISPPYTIPGVLAVTDHYLEGVDHLTFWMLADWLAGEPTVTEPTKCCWWKWLAVTEVAAEVGPAGYDPLSQQHHWTPLDLWQAVLIPHLMKGT